MRISIGAIAWDSNLRRVSFANLNTNPNIKSLRSGFVSYSVIGLFVSSCYNYPSLKGTSASLLSIRPKENSQTVKNLTAKALKPK